MNEKTVFTAAGATAEISEHELQIKDASIQKKFNENLEVAANNGKILGQVPLNQVFGFSRTFRRITKG